MTFSSRLSRAVLLCAALAAPAAPVHADGVTWLSDYNTARQAAHDKRLPLVIDFSIKNCTYCRALETTTFQDPAVVKLLSGHFIAVHLDGEKEAYLAQMLKINNYPTLVFADPDGKIVARQDGYVKPEEFAKQLDHVLAGMQPTDGSVEPAAAHVAAPPTPDAGGSERARRAGLLLALARADFREQRYLGCLERCKTLTADFADLPEAVEARRLEEQVRGDPEQMRLACENLTDRLGSMYLDLADAFLRKGQPQRAALCLEWVVQACPGTPQAETAKGRLAQIKDHK
jgi:thioredoxin-related protein